MVWLTCHWACLLCLLWLGQRSTPITPVCVPPHSHMVEYVYARYNFVPEHADEISFCAGERIEVVEKDDMYQDGWWKVRSRSPLIN